MDRLAHLYHEFGQSPWLDNLKRGYITSGQLGRLVDHGIRGLTSNPTIFQKAIQGSRRLRRAVPAAGRGRARRSSTTTGRWCCADINGALDVFAALYHDSHGADGFVSVEVDPGLAHDRSRHRGRGTRPAREDPPPESDGQDPATAEGVGADPDDDRRRPQHQRHVDLQPRPLRRGDGSLHPRFGVVRRQPGADLSKVASVASFFISRVDTEIDHRLDAIGSPEALALRGKGAVAQGKLAYQMFQKTFSGPRWEALVAQGPSCSVRCGPARRPRTRRTPTRCTSTS